MSHLLKQIYEQDHSFVNSCIILLLEMSCVAHDNNSLILLCSLLLMKGNDYAEVNFCSSLLFHDDLIYF